MSRVRRMFSLRRSGSFELAEVEQALDDLVDLRPLAVGWTFEPPPAVRSSTVAVTGAPVRPLAVSPEDEPYLGLTMELGDDDDTDPGRYVVPLPTGELELVASSDETDSRMAEDARLAAEDARAIAADDADAEAESEEWEWAMAMANAKLGDAIGSALGAPGSPPVPAALN